MAVGVKLCLMQRNDENESNQVGWCTESNGVACIVTLEAHAHVGKDLTRLSRCSELGTRSAMSSHKKVRQSMLDGSVQFSSQN